MKISLALVVFLCLSLCSVDAMKRGKKRRGKQGAPAGGGGGGEECPGGDELECLRQNIPGEPKADYPIYGQSFLCKLNPKNPGCPGWGK